MPDGPVEIWGWDSTTNLAPAAPGQNGPLEFSRALFSGLGGYYRNRYIFDWSTKDSVVAVLDRGMDANSKWRETDLIDDPEKRRKEGWYTFDDSDTWADCNTPLHMAMVADSMDTVALLLSRGANINIYNARGQTVLYKAVSSRSTKWVEFLLLHGADGDAPTVNSSVTCWFARQPFINRHDVGGSPPLFEAISKQNEKILKLLLDAGADVNRLILGWRFLDLAILGRDLEIIETLLSKGARFSIEASGIIHLYSTGESKQDELSATTEIQKIAKDLLASSKKIPSTAARGVFDKIICSESVRKVFQDTRASSNRKATDLVTVFFDLLSRLARTVNPIRPPLPHCDRCMELQSGPAFRGDGRTWSWGRLGALIQSASSSCPVCKLLLDAVRYPQYGQEKPIEIEDEVYVDAYSGRWEIQCGVRKTTINIRPIFDNLMYGITEVSDDIVLGTASPLAFEMARRWLEHCESNHTKGGDSYTTFNCPDPPKDPPRLPTRVVYVGKEGDSPRLMETNNLCAPYCALSYCWGKTKALITTRVSLASHLREIPVNALPNTPKDAIYATRQLGLQYIWIDSLCIVQDNEEDWERETQKMRDVYYNARLVLCASDSGDCDGGLFRKRRERLISPVQLTVSISSTAWPGKTCMYALPARSAEEPKGTSPVDRRAWTLQETSLCVRILRFTAGILRWECLSVNASETDPDGMYAASKPHVYDSFCRERRLLQGRPLYRTSTNSMSTWPAEDEDRQRVYEAGLPYEAWEKTVGQYSTRAVTKQTDRIPAILALGQSMEAVLGDQFVAGVWKEKFCLRSLCWQAERPGLRVMHYPSWSWASTTSPVCYSMLCTEQVRRGAVTWHACVLECNAQVSGPQSIVRGTIRIKSMMRQSIKNLVCKKKSWGYNNGTSCARGIEYVDQTFIDRSDNTLSGCFYIIIASIKRHENHRPRVVCLLVKPSDDAKDIWRRVGICSIEDTKDFWVSVERDHIISIV